jgi:Skp family chaperone for outer membrane proteins
LQWITTPPVQNKHQKGLVTQNNNKIAKLDEILQANLSTIYAQNTVNKKLAQQNNELQKVALTQKSVLSRIKIALQKVYSKLSQSIRELLNII